MTQRSDARHKKEWHEVYKLIKAALQSFGKDEEAGAGDYFIIDDIIDPHTHLVEIHKLHMLRPEVMEPLQRVLIGFPDWQIHIFVVTPDGKTIISPENGLTLRSDGIIDTLDRTLLPPEYHGLRYPGSSHTARKTRH
jgi:hypothetical protein